MLPLDARLKTATASPIPGLAGVENIMPMGASTTATKFSQSVRCTVIDIDDLQIAGAHWSTMRTIAGSFVEMRPGATNRYLMSMGDRCIQCRPVLACLMLLSHYMGGKAE